MRRLTTSQPIQFKGEVRLEHLVVHPRGGLCNRLRAIASAKRLSSLTGARCTIVWDWGDYRALFDDDTEWVPYAPPMEWKQDRIIPGHYHIRHLNPHEGGAPEYWRVPVTTHSRIAVTSLYVFCAAEEPLLHHRKGTEAKVLPWIPKPHPVIMDKIDAFHQAYIPPRTVGMHIRRTDNRRAIDRSPDKAYFREGDRLVERGYPIFLATDNQDTLRIMQRRYGGKLIHYPKTSAMEKRWPRKTSQFEDIVDDIVDLWLLVSCDSVIGSRYSSYSRVAILLNGSDECKVLDRPVAQSRAAASWIWHHYFRRRAGPPRQSAAETHDAQIREPGPGSPPDQP